MKKIGEIKGVPVVEGDANLVKNQILYKETDKGISLSKRTNGKLEEVSGGSNTGEGSVETPRSYYKIKQEFIGLNNEAYPEVAFTISYMDIGFFILQDKYNNINFECPTSRVFVDSDFFKNYSTPYFCIENRKNFILVNYKFEYGGIINGVGIKERYINMTKLASPDMSDEELEAIYEESLGAWVQEISKEEYESLITHRVE